MTTDQYIAKIQGKIKELQTNNKPFAIAVNSTMALQSHRIFIEGKNSSGSDLGNYNTTNPLYVNPKKASPKAFPVKGKPEANRNIKDRKTGWFESYASFKRTIGQKTDKVRPHLFGDLESDFRNAPVNSTASKPTKVNTNEYITVLRRTKNPKKVEGLEKKYGVFTDLTQQERAAFFRVNEFELRKFMAS